MAKARFAQSKAGNITVVDIGSMLLIWVDGVGYAVTNPTSPGVFEPSVGEVAFSWGAPVGAIKEAVDAEADKMRKKIIL